MRRRLLFRSRGFADQYHFPKVFDRLQHNTPKKFRDSCAEFKFAREVL